jgi:Tetracyclin repressor-like, C-terminal domain
MTLSKTAFAGAANAFSTEILSPSTRSRDKRISADIVAEMEIHLSEKVTTIPQMRRILAVRGYNELRRRIESDVKGKNGNDALHAMARAMRNFAIEHPGLSAATFRRPASDCPDWRKAGLALSKTVFQVFARIDVVAEAAEQAPRILHSFVRGFVLNEMAGSFLIEPQEYAQTFDLGIQQFILGLPALKTSTSRRYRSATALVPTHGINAVGLSS